MELSKLSLLGCVICVLVQIYVGDRIEVKNWKDGFGEEKQKAAHVNCIKRGEIT